MRVPMLLAFPVIVRYCVDRILHVLSIWEQRVVGQQDTVAKCDYKVFPCSLVLHPDLMLHFPNLR